MIGWQNIERNTLSNLNEVLTSLCHRARLLVGVVAFNSTIGRKEYEDEEEYH